MHAPTRVRGSLCLLAFACAVALVVPATAQDEQPTQKVAVKGEFVRVVANDEGWVVLGYRVANDSVGEQWMLLEVGITLMPDVKDQKLTREDLTVTLPDGSSIPLATQEEFSKASLRALDARANMVRDSLNYFPVGVDTPCRIGFFTDISQPVRGLAYDSVDLSSDRACAGRLYFHIPDGIQYGQHFLNVAFAGSTVNVPFKIMTKDELKENKAKWKEMEKQLKAQEKGER